MKALILKLLPYLIGLLLVTGFVNRCNKAYQEAQDKKRIEKALVISQAPLKAITGKNGQQAAKTDVMQLTAPELKKTYPGLVSEAGNLYIKSSNIQGVIQEATVTSQNIATGLKDSLVISYRDSLRIDTVHVKIFNYKDAWTNIRGTVGEDSIKQKIENKDTLTAFLHKGDRAKPWLWFFSKRKLQLVAKNSNPHTILTFQRYIEVH